MPLYFSENQSVIFFHIPKTGGTSIESWLMNSMDCKQLLFNKFVLDDMLVTPQHLGYSTIKKLLGEDVFNKSFKFAIVRNPFDRLESEFFYRVKMGDIKLGKNPERYFSPWLIDAFNEYRTNPSIYDNHFRPQVYYYGQDVKFFKFESGLDVIASEIAKCLRMKEFSEMGHKKISERKSVIWSKKAIEMAREIYEEDFNTLNYPKEICESHSNFTFRNTPALLLKYKIYRILNRSKAIGKRVLYGRTIK